MTDEAKVTPDDIAGAIMELFNTLLLMYKMDGYIPSKEFQDQLPNRTFEPFSVPFADNVDRAVERFDNPELRQRLADLIYGRTEERQLLEKLMEHADCFINAEGRDLLAEDGTVVYSDGFLMEVDPKAWKETAEFLKKEKNA